MERAPISQKDFEEIRCLEGEIDNIKYQIAEAKTEISNLKKILKRGHLYPSDEIDINIEIQDLEDYIKKCKNGKSEFEKKIKKIQSKKPRKPEPRVLEAKK